MALTVHSGLEKPNLFIKTTGHYLPFSLGLLNVQWSFQKLHDD